MANPSEFSHLESTGNLWAGIRWADNSEGIIHSEDLILRLVRLGYLLPGGGLSLIDRINKIIQKELC